MYINDGFHPIISCFENSAVVQFRFLMRIGFRIHTGETKLNFELPDRLSLQFIKIHPVYTLRMAQKI